MPYKIIKVKNKNCYMVKNKISGKIFSYCTTKKNALKQVKLLGMLDAGRKTKY